MAGSKWYDMPILRHIEETATSSLTTCVIGSRRLLQSNQPAIWLDY